MSKLNGAPGTTRTCDPLIRSQVLYPAELRVQSLFERVALNIRAGLVSVKQELSLRFASKIPRGDRKGPPSRVKSGRLVATR
jgi:hypothetical protein